MVTHDNGEPMPTIWQYPSAPAVEPAPTIPPNIELGAN